MTEDKGILIKNIFYMLSYAYQVLNQTNYEKIAAESFDNIYDLFAAILSSGMSQQIKQGLYKEYILINENLTSLKGKLNINDSIRNRTKHIQRLSCDFDELSENNQLNQIIKTTADILRFSEDVSKTNKRNLSNALLGFSKVDQIDPLSINWSTISFRRNSQSYRMMIFVCYFVLQSYLMTTTVGDFKMAQFVEEHMAALYERFILEYYRKHHPEFHPVASEVKFDIRGELTDEAWRYLPKMKSDITLTSKYKKLIIDAKYYKQIWQKYDLNDPETSTTIRNGHLYQIMSYVHNTDTAHTGSVSGMLLYAQTGTQSINLDYPNINGNHYGVRTLDLNTDFTNITAQLESITDSFLKTSDK